MMQINTKNAGGISFLLAMFVLITPIMVLGAFDNVELEPVAFGSKVIGADAADIDGDGDLDFLSYQSHFSHLHLTVNNGSGLATYYLTNYANDGKFIDVDGDGDVDIANVFNYGGVGQHGIQIRLNDGNGGFTHSSTMSNTDLGTSLSNIASIAAGDFDNDGDMDLVIAGSRWSQRLTVLANDGAGNFTEHFNGTWGNGQTNDATEVQFADFDGDNDLDIFLTAQTWGNGPLPMVWENTGSGFTPAFSEAVGAATFLWTADASVADMDNDGDMDIVAQAQGAFGTQSQAVIIYENLGSFSFAGHLIYDHTGQSAGGVRAADMDYDGDMDLVTTTGLQWGGADNQRLMILENQGGLNFVSGFEGSQMTGTLATIINSVSWVGDAEGDGDNEVLTGEYYAGFLWGFNSPPPVVETDPPPTELGISGWEMNRGGGYINLGQHIGTHGNPILYNWSNIPSTDDANWGPAPNTETIGFSETSTLPGGTCFYYADFTYFQTFLSIPENTVLNEVTVNFSGADDGAQITVYNSLHPNGFSPPSAYIYLGGPAETTDISEWIAVGEVNRVVITQVDDCPSGNNLVYAAIVLNGTPILLNQAPTADAGEDQNIDCVVGSAEVTLSGSGSDEDGDPLTYSWSDGSSVVSTEASFTTSLGGGTHTFTLTVSDGEEEATDAVSVTVNFDETAPVISELADITVDNDEGVCGAEVSFSFDATDACGVTSLSATHESGSVFAVGTTEVTVTSSDAAGNTSTSSFTVTVNDVEAPVIADNEDMTVSNDPGQCGALVVFNDTAEDNCNVAEVVAVPESGSFFEVGTTTVTITATDDAGNESTSSFDVTVEDNEAPNFVVSADPETMWPPNHKYRTFDISDFVVTVEDNCADLGLADIVITSVTSDEAENARGRGDGNTNNDMVIGDGSVDLRAERQGGGNGRVYTVHMAVADDHGNSSASSFQVHVPHSRNSTAIDDGVAYTVTGASLAKFTGRGDELTVVPSDYALDQNYPNPFNPSTTISYGLPQDAVVSLRVFDMRGSLVHELVSGYQVAGSHEVNFQAYDISSGTYIYVLEAGSFREVKRMVYLK